MNRPIRLPGIASAALAALVLTLAYACTADRSGLTAVDEGDPVGATATITGGGPNLPPVADAGPDQMLSDADGSGDEQVMLDGSASSDPDGTISAYRWVYNGQTLTETADLTVTLPVGVHTLVLGVRDDKGATATDQVVVSIAASGAPVNQPPIADAGPDQTLPDADGSGDQPVTLDGSGSSDPDGAIMDYRWTLNGQSIAETAVATITLPVGVHTILLGVRDDKEATATDQVRGDDHGVGPDAEPATGRRRGSGPGLDRHGQLGGRAGDARRRQASRSPPA